MNLLRPLEILPGVYQLRSLGARVTVLVDGDGVVMVDAGARGASKLLTAGLSKIGASLQDVRLVVLTHHHPDHAGGVAEFLRATPAKVAAHREEAGILAGKERLPNPYRNPLQAGAVHLFLPFLYGPPVDVDYLLEDGQRLPMTQEVRVIHTPGHTPGSICLHVVAKKLLIVGDMLQYRFGRLSPASRGVSWDFEQAKNSLEKLVHLDVDVVCFSHFPPFHGDLRPALQHLLQRRRR